MHLASRRLRPELMACAPELVVFDKGGTLIEFHGMWSAWVIALARRLEDAAGRPMTERIFEALGFEPSTRWIDPEGRLAMEPMANLWALVVDLLCKAGLSHQTAEEITTATWFAPDPIDEARPLTDVPALFGALREQDLKIAIATMDDRAPTETTLAYLGVADWVDALVCADDGLPPKPAPDMVRAVCGMTSVDPAHTIVVGDAVTDLLMGRAAGAGAVVGVLSGVAPEKALAPQADVVLQSVIELIK